LPILVFLIGLGLAAFATRELWMGWREYEVARSEYADLRDSFTIQTNLWNPAPTETGPDTDPGAEPGAEPEPGGAPEADVDLAYFFAINPDFAGWISIADTAVAYPIVQGQDNERYLHTTFRGQSNAAGTIFLDYRARAGFDTPVAILYGHNMQDGSMFAPLLDYRDPAFLEAHPDIRIMTAEGEFLTYRIFEVRYTDAWDSVYALDFHDEAAAIQYFQGAPAGANQFLVLSTCVGADPAARLVILSARQ